MDMGLEAIALEERLQGLFLIKHGPENKRGWSPELRSRFGYYSPDDYYESCVDLLVDGETEWLDVGGGHSILPNNPRLSAMLARKCKRLVAVDPSPNVHDNRLAHECV